MEYEILGDSLPVVVCRLAKGEKVFTQVGGMGWMTSNIKMETHIEGGIFKGIGRKLTGETFFMNTYVCTNGEGIVAFPSSFPGSILCYDLKPGESIIAQKKAFLCAEKSVDIKLFFKPRIMVGIFGREGFIMQKITGPGKVFLEIDGGSISYNIPPGEALVVDPGHIATMAPTIEIDMKFVRGVRNLLFGGEGLFLTELKGPGEVWLQTMPLPNVARSLSPYLVRSIIKTPPPPPDPAEENV